MPSVKAGFGGAAKEKVGAAALRLRASSRGQISFPQLLGQLPVRSGSEDKGRPGHSGPTHIIPARTLIIALANDRFRNLRQRFFFFEPRVQHVIARSSPNRQSSFSVP
jgi:hypothetical protein